MSPSLPARSGRSVAARVSTRRASATLAAVLGLGLLTSPAHAAFNPDNLAPSSISISSVASSAAPYFADAAKLLRPWSPGSNWDQVPITQLNAFGLPKAANATDAFQSLYSPDGDKSVLNGRVVVTWTGTGNVRLTGGGVSFVEGTAAGASNGGRRVYTLTGVTSIFVNLSGLTSEGLTSLNIWLPHPADPSNTSLEPAERAAFNTARGITESAESFFFHPRLLQVLKERPWSSIRYMDFTATNGNPSVNWSERRKPNVALQRFSTVSRNPRTGASPESQNGSTVYRDPGAAWEYAIALSNATDADLWITVPHLSVLSLGGSDDYLLNLAKLIAYGSDAEGKIYPADYTGTKVHPPLKAGLDVYVEYSNEVWNDKFDQYYWNDNLSSATTNAQQMAAHSLAAWNAFESVTALKSATVDRVVRVLGTQQVDSGPLTQRLNYLYDTLGGYADVVATASYFGNDIEAYVRDALLEGEKNPDTTSGAAPYLYPADAANRFTDQFFDKASDEWTRRILFGDAASNNGFDSTGVQGGIETAVYAAAAARNDSAGKPLRIIATEGAPSIYTYTFDNGAPGSGIVTNFIVALQYRARMAELMKIHLELGRSRGLRNYNIYTLTGANGKFGQWGLIELNDKWNDPADARTVRYRAVRDWFDKFQNIRHVGAPLGTAPTFTTGEQLADVRVGSSFSYSIATANATSLEVVGKVLDPNVEVVVSGTTATIRTKGTTKASKHGLNFVLLRALDNDKDPAWRIFRFGVKDYSKHIYFNNLAAGTFSLIDEQGYLLSTADGSASLQITPVGGTTATSHAVRVTQGVAVHLDAKTASASPLDNRPFDFDSIRLGRGNTTVTGVFIEGLSEAGKVVKTQAFALTGTVDTLATVTRDTSWDNLHSVRLRFYSSATYNSTTKVWTIVPAAGGIFDDVRINI